MQNQKAGASSESQKSINFRGTCSQPPTGNPCSKRGPRRASASARARSRASAAFCSGPRKAPTSTLWPRETSATRSVPNSSSNFLFEPHPGRVETPDLALAAGGDLLENEFERRQLHRLIGVGGAEAYLECDIKRQDVEPHEADHRPRAHDEEGRGENEIEAAKSDNKVPFDGARRHRAIGRQSRRVNAVGRGIASITP